VRLEREARPDDKTAELQGRLADLKGKLAAVEADLDTQGFSDLLARKARQWEAESASIAEQLTSAQAQRNTPAAVTGDIIDNPTTVEERERMRALIKRLVKQVRVWILGNTATRTLYADVEFVDARHRLFALRVERRRIGEAAGAVIVAGTDQPLNPARFQVDGERLAKLLLDRSAAAAAGKLRVTKTGMVVQSGRR